MKSEISIYIKTFWNRIGIPLEAENEMLKVVKTVFSSEGLAQLFLKSKTELMYANHNLDEALAAIGSASKELNISEYTLHFVFLVYCTDILFANYDSKQINEQVFWDTMEDFRCKLLECHEVMGVWGTFVARWYAGILSMKIIALGRFQYEETFFKEDPYKKNGIVVNSGDKVYSLHIPSSGKALDMPSRIVSYRKAYDFFRCKEKGENLVLVCYSWLLYQELETILPSSSNILDFMHDFDIVSTTETESFDDAWRIFGKHHTMPVEQLPKDTSLRKAIAGHLSAGGKMGHGFGVIVFDGEKIINK